jgi:hypothetical protein
MTPDQHRRIQQALVSHRQPPRTTAARLRDGIEYTKKKGRIMGLALSDISQTKNERRYQRRQTKDERCLQRRV